MFTKCSTKESKPNNWNIKKPILHLQVYLKLNGSLKSCSIMCLGYCPRFLWLVFLPPPQGPKPLWLRVLPVPLSSWWSALCLQLQRPPGQARRPPSRHRLSVRSHAQRREPRSRGRASGARPRQPHPHEEDVRHGAVAQPGRGQQSVGVLPLAQPQLHGTRHAVADRRATGGEGKQPHPTAVLQEEPAGGGQRLHGRRHRFHRQPQETHLQDLQEAEEMRAVWTPGG